MVDKVEKAEMVERVENVTDEDEGLVKTPRGELTDAKDLAILMTSMRQSRWMSVVDVKTTENPQDIEETWIEVKRRTRTQEPVRRSQKESNR